MSRNRVWVAALAACLILAGCGGAEPAFAPDAGGTAFAPQPHTAAPQPTLTASLEPAREPTPVPTPVLTPTPAPEPTVVNLMAVGDIMFQYFEIQSAYDKASKSYEFGYSLQYIKDILRGADLAMGNFECTLGGKPPYSQRKSLIFNAPDAAADALAEAGFDVLQTANNHANNSGGAGILRTLQVLGDRGMTCVGVRKSVENKPYALIDVKGVRLGITAYTWCTRPGGVPALDNQKLDPAVRGLVNVFSNKAIEEDLAAMAEVARRMRDDGAEVVIFMVHWGAEYRRDPDRNQKQIAEGLAAAGVDAVIGSHPHWLQTVDLLPNGVTGGQTVVAYSLGNFLSCQRDEFKGTGYNFKYSEDCMILNLKIVKQPDGSTKIEKVEYLPAWTYMYTTGGRHFTVLPLEKALADPEAYGLNTKSYVRQAQKSFENTQELLAGAVERGILTIMEP